jgi:hypothetical protein
MERLDQGHLHPILEVPGLHVPAGIRTRACYVGGEHSRKEPSRQFVNCYSELLHLSPRQNVRYRNVECYGLKTRAGIQLAKNGSAFTGTV